MGLHSARHWGDTLMNWVDAAVVSKLSRVQWGKQKSTGDYNERSAKMRRRMS